VGRTAWRRGRFPDLAATRKTEGPNNPNFLREIVGAVALET
jgi:hypothetical protein